MQNKPINQPILIDTTEKLLHYFGRPLKVRQFNGSYPWFFMPRIELDDIEELEEEELEAVPAATQEKS